MQTIYRASITPVNPYLGNSIQSGFPTEILEASLGCIMAHVVIWKILCTSLIIDSKGAVRLLSVKHILLICRVNLRRKILTKQFTMLSATHVYQRLDRQIGHSHWPIEARKHSTPPWAQYKNKAAHCFAKLSLENLCPL